MKAFSGLNGIWVYKSCETTCKTDRRDYVNGLKWQHRESTALFCCCKNWSSFYYFKGDPTSSGVKEPREGSPISFSLLHSVKTVKPHLASWHVCWLELKINCTSVWLLSNLPIVECIEDPSKVSSEECRQFYILSYQWHCNKIRLETKKQRLKCDLTVHHWSWCLINTCLNVYKKGFLYEAMKSYGKNRIKLMIFIKCIVLKWVILCSEIVNVSLFFFTRPYVTSQFCPCFVICFNSSSWRWHSD